MECETPKQRVAGFYNEAKVTDLHANVLRRRFDQFCTCNSETFPEPYLSWGDFRKFNKHYEVCAEWQEHYFFRAMDRNHKELLTFIDFLTGCVAASPTTPHILNSYTGYMRARFIFDMFNTTQSGTLDYEELERLVWETRTHIEETIEARNKIVLDLATEMGEVNSVVLVLKNEYNIYINSVRISTRWTGLRVKREIARFVDVRAEAQFIMIDAKVLEEEDLLENFIPEDARSYKVTFMELPEELQRERTPKIRPAPSQEQIPSKGLERFVHIPFERFYEALVDEKFRGTSRLFRFQRSVIHPKRASAAPSMRRRLVSGA